MIKSDIKKSKIYPVLVLEYFVSEKNLARLSKLIVYFFLLFVFVILGGWAVNAKMNFPSLALLDHWLWLKLLGILTITLGLMAIIFMLRSYLRASYYFENVVKNQYHSKDLYTFTVGRILYRTPGDDWLAGFLLSDTGRIIMARCGISAEQITKFLTGRTALPLSITLDSGKLLKLREFVEALYKENADFGRLLYGAGMGEEDLLSVCDWVVKMIESDEMSSRFWRRENLERLGSIGKSWSYGATPRLDSYSDDLLDRPEAQFSAYEVNFRDPQVRQIENVLARGAQSNILLIGENAPVRMDVLMTFVREIKRGRVLNKLEHKRVLLFNTSLFVSSFKERDEFGHELYRVMNEAVSAGDVILVFDDFAGFVSDRLPFEVFSLLDKYLASSRLQIIAMSDIDKFHRTLESRSDVMARFERVIIPELTAEEAVMTLLSAVDQIEAHNKIAFTFQALKQVVNSADAYLGEGSLTDKSRGLIIELVPWFLKTGRTLVLPADVSSYVAEKTNIPTGTIGEEEKTTLLNLEEVLHGRVVGQDEAVKAIASAMKRARAGVQNAKRPLGSFLFLGPTGVGKTETAKALAAAYFGSEDKLMRLDMTEYQDAEALDKLIGSFKDGKPGILANMIRKNVYGVLLLDEFEKTNQDVLNLFLQILDEGFFSDMDGKRVNARNIIFIATSNAGSSQIWNMVKAGKNPAESKDELINQIVQAGTFKPELLNRFDDCVIFQPLAPADLKQIAMLMIKRLAKRLEPKGVNLTVNDFLAEKVSKEGSNEVFGARPMNRYIQDKVEQTIADKMIAGDLKPGMQVEFGVSADPAELFAVKITE